jgi:pyrophosphatase PpaX
MKTYNYILLDWDGNLAKTLDIWLEACRIVLSKRGINLSDNEIATCFGAPVKRFTDWGVTDIEAAINEMDELAKVHLPDVELYPNAIEVLEKLKDKGKSMALITASSHDKIQHLLDKYNMNGYFGAVTAGDDVKEHKPHPEPLEKAMALLGANKQESIMIGDSDKDLGAANNTGIDSILFYPPENNKFYALENLKSLNPTYVVEDFRQVEGIIN